MKRYRIAVLVSGTGRHLENLAELSKDPRADFPVDVVLAISNRPGVQALERAERCGVPASVIAPEPDETDEAYGARVFDVIREANVDAVVLAGFLKKLWIPDDHKGRVINIHPSLLPAFGGKGFYGGRVHRAVLERGCQVTGCTVHLVDEIYDNGPILLQRWCPVEPGDTAETLARRVFEEELLALPIGVLSFLEKQ
ncbi:Phosphoribosylglycinamide formyltransferase [Planctomycetes bacterium Poly30]|uniref:Phosphoribosylglycinamide formyltransferase n=1 Tax=Saltatorellus ferox TaxID=2528018 RepID=A0A518ETP9_9BACT|nr:Phosphoribosylglycinamide formyltransferase [Planctomycetes bacterium Poly30]